MLHRDRMTQRMVRLMVLFANVIFHVSVPCLILMLDYLHISNFVSTYHDTNFFVIINFIIVMELLSLLFVTYTCLSFLLIAANLKRYPDIPPYNIDFPQRTRDIMSYSPCPSNRETVIKSDHDSSVQFSSLTNVTDPQEIAR